ncbi:ribonuclease HII [Nanoarchaeota archaeon]|nr:MAG: ribonuclease HII [Nanoarchaeota archaeon]
MVVGIDEAGRGSFVGPLVICGVELDQRGMRKLREDGVKDSKLLSSKRREELAKKIRKVAKKVTYEVISAQEIDERMSVGTNLNAIEAIHMAKIINKMRPRKVIIDAPSGVKKFREVLEKYLEVKPKMVLEHKADQKYVVVSAASILAKVRRDKELRKIEKETGVKLGVGYPHDEVCINGVKNHMKALKKYIRHKWSTYGRITQRRLEEYG